MQPEIVDVGTMLGEMPKMLSRLMGEQTELRVMGPERRGLFQRLLWRTA